MPVLVKCECGQSLQAPDKAAGKAVRCPECGEAVKVPAHKAEPKEESEDDFSELEPAPPRRAASSQKLPAAVLKSTKKKAKPTTQAAEPGIPKWVWALFILVGFGVGSVGGYLGVTAILSAAAKDNADAPPEPLTYSEHAHKEGNFKFDYPNGWEVASGGGTGGVPPWGTFSKDDVSVDIRADLKGASIADIANAAANQSTEELPPELSPVAKVHQFQHDVKYKIEYDDFEETPGGFYDVPFGRGWLSEFTASEGAFGGKIHGYRLTLLGGMHQFNVICKCQEKNWRKNEPMFERVLKSISR
ncbi:MAG: hypothetical protein U0992_25265 [Planctomycetaceae bacterium]